MVMNNFPCLFKTFFKHIIVWVKLLKRSGKKSERPQKYRQRLLQLFLLYFASPLIISQGVFGPVVQNAVKEQSYFWMTFQTTREYVSIIKINGQWQQIIHHFSTVSQRTFAVARVRTVQPHYHSVWTGDSPLLIAANFPIYVRTYVRTYILKGNFCR